MQQYFTATLSELKAIAAELKVTPTGDKRSKQSWIDAIESCQTLPLSIDDLEATLTNFFGSGCEEEHLSKKAESAVLENQFDEKASPSNAYYTTTAYKLIDLSSFDQESINRAKTADPAKVQQIVESAAALGTLIAPIVAKFAGFEDYAEQFTLVHGSTALAAALELQRINPRQYETVGVTIVSCTAPEEAILGQFLTSDPLDLGSTPSELPSSESAGMGAKTTAITGPLAVAASLTVMGIAIARTMLKSLTTIASKSILPAAIIFETLCGQSKPEPLPPCTKDSAVAV
jgi:hypothetical protein